jgi:hypothetical protein
MTHVFDFLKEQPFILLFLMVGAGFAFARLKTFRVSLGVLRQSRHGFLANQAIGAYEMPSHGVHLALG